MSVNFRIYLIVAAVLLCLDVFIILNLIIRKLKSVKSKKVSRKQEGILLNTLSGSKSDVKSKLSVSKYLTMKQSIYIDRLERENIEKHIDINKIEKKQLKRLKSIFRNVRIEASVYLGVLGTENARLALEKSIIRETYYPAKLYMANALADICCEDSIPVLVKSLIGARRWYRDRVNMLLSDFGEAFNSYLIQIIDSGKIEIKELIVDFASTYFSEHTVTYLVKLIDTKEEEYSSLVYKAAGILASYYPKVLGSAKYLNSTDTEIRNAAVKALASFNTIESVEKLLQYLREDSTARSAVYAISMLIEKNPGYINYVAKKFEEEKDIKTRQRLAEILSSRIEYFIMKLASKNKTTAAEAIRQMVLLGRTSEVIDFLNKNKDIDIENELIAIIKGVVATSDVLKNEFSRYLSERLLTKCGLPMHKEVIPKKEEQKDRKLKAMLYSILALVLLTFPVVYALRHYDIILNTPIIQQINIFILDYNYYFLFYSIALNMIYLCLLLLSNINAKRQLKLWNIKNISLLFKKRMLPSISIIAPAFNEEKTIIESSNSLLNLKYPDYELIIVNDGSKDRTLDVLIKYFDLIRVDHIFECRLNTKLIRGIYMNRSMPKLIVVNKENGGKADSLNAGINISRKEYFCGIDADSLLEEEALLKLASLTLDVGVETPALGGNIFPINGCTIERGQIKKIRIPENRLARFQTIEYIRAFMAGRLGWAFMNSLLIISGAFGLFRKERVISAGGYLTSSGKYAKDTVGEDMELVVRISRLMRELGQKYKICYALNANCWTEVPEDLKSLKKQRYRWHKGLIDILTFHKKVLFNPKYGRTGIIAMPYFFIFEMIGPLFEILGYIMIAAAFILGLLDGEIAILIFIATVLAGMLVSISSLLIAEEDIKNFRMKDILMLILYAILENFGPRQLFSLWRVGGYLSMLRNTGGWDKAERKGFAAPNTASKV